MWYVLMSDCNLQYLLLFDRPQQKAMPRPRTPTSPPQRRSNFQFLLVVVICLTVVTTWTCSAAFVQQLSHCINWLYASLVKLFDRILLVAGNWKEPPGSVTSTEDTCVYLDCTPIDDPATKPFRWHLGFHRGIIHAVIEHRKFPELILKAAWYIKHRNASVVFCGCRQGRHRSVAVALIIQHVMREIFGSLYAIDIEFACKDRWTEFHHKCSAGACWDCCGPMPNNIGRAVELWRSV